jgi:hypothetical protein
MHVVTKIGIAAGAVGVVAAGGALAWAFRDVGWSPASGSGTDPKLEDDRRALHAAIDLLQTVPTGRQAVAFLERDHTRITIVDDPVFRASRHGSQSAQYQPWNDENLIRRGKTNDIPRLALSVAHESFHRNRRWHDSMSTVGAGIAGAWNGAVTMLPGGAANGSIAVGATLGFIDALHGLEADAYAFQAQLATELGLADRGAGTNADGSRATTQQARDRLSQSTTYTKLPEPEDGPRPTSADAENSFVVHADGVEHVPWLDAERGLRQRLEARSLDD